MSLICASLPASPRLVWACTASFQRVRVGLVGRIILGRYQQPRVQIERVLRLVGQVRRAVFHAGDAVPGGTPGRPRRHN
ncbi:MAG: hypothetical protein WD872_20575, partial [Pirellulaceae bacterium]